MRDAEPIADAEFSVLMQGVEPFESAPRMAVACSGGADSLALALLTARWAAARDGCVTALIVDHALRPESAVEARETACRLKGLGIAAEILPWRGRKPTASVQAAARAARYGLLERWCRDHGVLHLATGHHRDDQAETLLMRLGRGGGGGDGLAAMPAVRELTACRVIRPLLPVPRARLAATLRQVDMGWVEDPSNRDHRFERVRVRRTLSAGAVNAGALAESAATHGRARVALEQAAARLLAEGAALMPEGYARLAPPTFADAPEEVGRRALARLLTAVGGRAYAPAALPLARLWRRIVQDGATARGSLSGCRLAAGPEGDLLVVREGRNLPAPQGLAAGRLLHWDGRFAVACPARLPPGLRLAAYGSMAGAAHLPAAVRPATPALWAADGSLMAVGPTARGERFPSIVFRPMIALSGAGFYAGGAGATAA